MLRLFVLVCVVVGGSYSTKFQDCDKEIREATTMVHGILKGVPVPFPLPDDNACNFMICPISAGTTIVYSVPFECEESYPEMELQVKWEVKDENGKSFICFQIPIEIIA